MIYDVSHKTVYIYTTPVVQSQHVVHMSPRVVERQKVKGHALLIDPAPTIRAERVDYYGNRVVMFDIEQEHAELTVHAKSTIEVTAREAVDLPGSAAWESVSEAPASGPGGLPLEVVCYA